MSEFEKIIDRILNGEGSLSYSSLSAFTKSPKHFKKYKLNKETTKAMEEGKRFHMACLEPDKFNEKYWVLDDSDKIEELIEGGAKNPKATNKYKDWLKEQESNNEGKEMIGKVEYDMYIEMSKTLRENSSTKELMSGLTATEHPFSIDYDGIVVKGSIDGVGNDGSYAIDLKKVADASFEKIKWDIRKKNYHLQGGLYASVLKTSEYYLIYIDSDYNVTVVKLSEETLMEGYSKFEKAISDFIACAEQDLWDESYGFYNGGYVLV